MSVSEDLIDFDIIEGQKENIQSLPGGRSARALASMFSPSPLHKLMTPTPSDTKNLNDAMRQEYEAELENIAESDDPLDIFDRYVKWTLDAYPSAQATPSSQLLPLLERATKAFLTSTQYKNDPRYLKMWLQYIRFFSDTPRETFAFLARHNIGDGLALFYEEFAAWLEGAGRWVQAEEVYKQRTRTSPHPQHFLPSDLHWLQNLIHLHLRHQEIRKLHGRILGLEEGPPKAAVKSLPFSPMLIVLHLQLVLVVKQRAGRLLDRWQIARRRTLWSQNHGLGRL